MDGCDIQLQVVGMTHTIQAAWYKSALTKETAELTSKETNTLFLLLIICFCLLFIQSDLMKERSKYQRTLNKKNQEYRSVSDEVINLGYKFVVSWPIDYNIHYLILLCFAQLEEVRASERNLRARCRSLTNELAVYKRG